MEEFHITAPGKIHLIGEHSVVYGEPAIISAIGMRTKLTIRPHSLVKINMLDQSYTFVSDELRLLAQAAHQLWEKGQAQSDFSELFILQRRKHLNFIKIAIGSLLNYLDRDEGFELSGNSTLPTGAGLGSSASLAVCLSATLIKYFEQRFDLTEINQQAFRIEQLSNGRPSGGDNTACCYGGLIKFQRSSADLSPKIEPMDFDHNPELGKFVIITTGKPTKTTGELLQDVSELDPTFRQTRCQRITSLIPGLIDGLQHQDSQAVADCLNQTHLTLKELGVSTDLLDQLQRDVQSIGGGAKLCGAGGGGALLAYHPNPLEIFELARRYQLPYFQTNLAAEGVKLS